MVLNYLLLASFHLANKMLLVGCYPLVDVTSSLSLSHILKPKYRRQKRLGWDLLELMTNLCIQHSLMHMRILCTWSVDKSSALERVGEQGTTSLSLKVDVEFESVV